LPNGHRKSIGKSSSKPSFSQDDFGGIGADPPFILQVDKAGGAEEPANLFGAMKYCEHTMRLRPAV
jgi:hypothetical protein